MPIRILGCLVLLFAFAHASTAEDPAFPVRAHRILFVGDSITFAGYYVTYMETEMLLAGIDPMPEMINLGLSSETVTGLTEPPHPFPRPNVHERLDRALNKIKPDVVVACYGMNDGIYAPFSTERFEKYQAGINLLIDKAHAAKAKVVLMTPPPFDPLPLRKAGKLLAKGAKEYAWTGIYEKYDEEVLTPYANWIMQQGDRVEMLIDLHSAVQDYIDRKRKANPEFTMSNDGVHVNHEGQQVMAEAILKAWQVKLTPHPDPQLLKLVDKRQSILKMAWLNEVGHKRPGSYPSLPIDEAKAKAQELEQKIRQRLQDLNKN